MTRRLLWFVGGAIAGIAGASAAKKKVRTVTAELAPSNIAKKTQARLREAVAEGRRAAAGKQRELEARRDGRMETLADDLAAGDVVIVDGRPVEPGQVIVLRQVRDGSPRRAGQRD